MGINSTEVSYSFGQLGSVFTNVANEDIKPPKGKVFVAITFLEDTTFDTNSGLIGDNDARTGREYVGNSAAHDESAGNASALSGSGGKGITDADVFQAGLTIYGRWTTIDLASGSIIAYIGD